MASPILHVKIPVNVYQDNENICDNLIESFKEYIVFCEISFKVDEIEFKCHNDCSGLSDIDIRELIKNISNGK